MLENVAYAALGFVSVYLALESAWHFTACRLRSKEIQPCIFKEVKTILVSNPIRKENKRLRGMIK